MLKDKSTAREVMLTLADVARLVKTYVDRRAAEHGMTRAQWGALTRIARCNGLMQAEVAEQMDLQPISLVPILDKLCDQGLIERRVHPEDRRAKLLFLTAKGQALLDTLAPLADDIANELFGEMKGDDIAILLKRLGQLKDNIKRASETTRPPVHVQGQ